MADLRSLSASTGHNIPPLLSKRDSCNPCPAAGQTGDARCRLSSSIGTTGASGCSSCGCQKCPDQQIYANSVSNYCSATPSSTCAGPPKAVCHLLCLIDKRCTTLDFDRDLGSGIGGCVGCACQSCPGGVVYGSTGDYTMATPLSTAAIQQCPHMLYPIQPMENLCT